MRQASIRLTLKRIDEIVEGLTRSGGDCENAPLIMAAGVLTCVQVRRSVMVRGPIAPEPPRSIPLVLFLEHESFQKHGYPDRTIRLVSG